MNLLAIDPGPSESAYVFIDVTDCRPTRFGKIANDELLQIIRRESWLSVHIEMIASYGMPVGAEVFQTCVWIGRFVQIHAECLGRTPELVYRQPVKLHHCGSARAKDANVTQALVDRFTPGQPNHGKGTKAAPGFFYGFKADVWQAFALAVYAADMQLVRTLAGAL